MNSKGSKSAKTHGREENSEESEERGVKRGMGNTGNWD